MESPEYIVLESAFGTLSILCTLLLLGKPTPKVPGENKQERILFMDFVKGAAIVAVIGLHAISFAGAGPALNDYVWFGVPLFILVSGYLLGKRYAHELEFKPYAKKFLIRVVAVYSIFFVLAYLMTYGIDFNVPGFVLGWAMGSIGNYYFIPLIVQLYLIFPILNKHRKLIASWWFLLLVFWASLAFRLWDTDLQHPSWNSDPLSLVFFGRFAFYFVFGIYLSQFDIWEITAKKSAAIVISGGALIALRFFLTGGLFLGYFYPILVFFALHAVVHAVRSISIAALAEKCLAAVGRNSLVIYLVHGVPLYIAGTIIGETPGAPGYVAIIVLTLYASYVISTLFARFYWQAAGKFLGIRIAWRDN